MTWALVVSVFVCVTVGVWLVQQRNVTRIVLGVAVLGHGCNLALLAAGGRAGTPPFVGRTGPFADPLSQAMVLTAIVIGFGLTGFLLTVAWQSWIDDGDDEVEDDLEDRRVASLRGPDADEAADAGSPTDTDLVT